MLPAPPRPVAYVLCSLVALGGAWVSYAPAPTADDVLPYPPRPEECLYGSNDTPISQSQLQNGNRMNKYSRSAIIYSGFICVPLLLLYTLTLVRVGRFALVRIAIPTSAGGMVLGRWVGALARGATGDLTNEVAEDTGMVRFVIVSVAGAGAGAIDVAHAAAAGRVL